MVEKIKKLKSSTKTITSEHALNFFGMLYTINQLST